MKAKEFARHIFEQVKSNWYIPVTEHQVYSTAEQKIGVWMDQKPLYRKTINTTLPDSTNNADNSKDISFESLGLSNIDMIYTAHQFYDHAGEYMQETPIWINTNNWNTRGAYIDKGNRIITVRNATTANNGSTLYIVLHYTKTTDTATSPKVPYEPLHEWSTEEKLVGYWIDGKAVYEKTVTGTTPSTQSKGISTGLTGIDQAWIEQVLMKNTSGYTANMGYRDCFAGIKNDGSEIWFDISQPAFLSQPFIATLRYTKTT